jgi:hypothetical protein
MHLSGLWNTQQLCVRDLLFDEVVIDGLKQHSISWTYPQEVTS